MLAFSTIIVRSGEDFEYLDGTLFSLPVELKDQHRIQQYLKIEKLGWSKSEFGYMALVKVDNLGNKYIIPGLFLKECDRPTKKIHGYTAQFTKGQVEEYLDQHLNRLSDIRNTSEGELTSLVHDLRHLSSSIYHSALEADEAAKKVGEVAIRDRIRTIIASQTMLKVRIDYLDFSNSIERFEEDEEIPVYSRVDKVIRCFGANARHKQIKITLTGVSFRLAEGPNILDIVPYTLIENAIKYAPERTNITVKITDTDTTTNVTISSLGPIFENGEQTRIFERGFRGKNAIKVRINGTGLGLSVARSVIETFNGRIWVKQSDESQTINNTQYAETEFLFSLPTSGEDIQRKQKAESRRKKQSQPL
ncbi:sensor histidine kinase [Sneathiella chinensis]|uniref:histidine kinase n=1 Tax=Sneathiella chinensis TaxID=349750 RepID=A0ABQ5U1L9_9PROT|nr:HAMP domain-containing sensor histidine kinase [Sneathiella chinensis]GLQ06060.1 hypothetical protein GCM10007924_12810 [Sneathiella chinensis]